MKGILMLADSAQQDPNGKFHALGATWNVIGTPLPAIALVAIIDCPWDQTNQQHQLVIDLVDTDGRPVSFQQGPLGDAQPAVHVVADFEVGRPPGMPHGNSIRQQLVINMSPGMPLPPGQNYEFRMTIDGQHMDSWLATFYVRAPEVPPAFPG